MRKMNQFGTGATLADVIRERANDVSVMEEVQRRKLDGRNRNGARAIPATALDVAQGDAVGDVMTDGTYRYELVNAGGTLAWDRKTLSVGW